MSVSRIVLERRLTEWLSPDSYSDYCPNGLQVEGSGQVSSIITGVTACQALIDVAVECNAQVLLVHHGFFWRGEDARIVGMKRSRLRSLLANDINLFAYHLPLDYHAELGNNQQLAKQLGFSVDGVLGDAKQPAGLIGSLQSPVTGTQLSRIVAERLGREPLHIPAEREIRRIAWCTGAAQGFIEQAVAAGVDAFLTGEASEPTVHIARESGIHFFAAGHHATERYGIQALGEKLADEFGLQHRFVDIDNPV
ncbi:MAG: Nif3-like dinuclear metal center hexameric protein [Pseudomonadales bacterium]